MKFETLFLLIALTFYLAACTGGSPTASPSSAQEQEVLTVMTHDSFAVSAELIQQFEKK